MSLSRFETDKKCTVSNSYFWNRRGGFAGFYFFKNKISCLCLTQRNLKIWKNIPKVSVYGASEQRSDRLSYRFKPKMGEIFKISFCLKSKSLTNNK
jgi:hypothetical protein